MVFFILLDLQISLLGSVERYYTEEAYMKNIIILICLFQLFSTGNSLFGQELSSNQIDSIVNKSLDMIPQAGIAVAVVKDGKVIHSKGYGITSVSSPKKVDENTLFAIASITKSFTSAAIAILVDEGKISWNDLVVDYIPEFKMYDPYVTANFNIQDLLSHRSGLGLGAGDLMFWPDGSDFTVEDVLKSFQYQKPVSAFRTKYNYDNLLYIVAGELIERISGVSWAEFIENRIMKPIGMNRSAGVYKNIRDKSNVAVPHSSANGKLIEIEPYIIREVTMGAPGGIYSSVNDMSKWLLLQLNSGKYGMNLSQRLISDINHAEMLKPHTNISFNAKPEMPYKTHFEAYGLGWNISDKNGYVIFEHSGLLPGMASSILLIPELNAGIVVLTNTEPGGYSSYTIKAEILDAFIGVERKDWITEAQQYLQHIEIKQDSVLAAVWNIALHSNTDNIDLTNYTGSYKDNWFGYVEIVLKDGNLWFNSLRSPKLSGKMFFYKSNTFVIKWIYNDMPCDAFAMFNLDENGKTVSIKMKGISPNIDFSFDFQDLDLKRVEKKTESR
jgi:CubicO group peptidase (beta-lactamase class C family)